MKTMLPRPGRYEGNPSQFMAEVLERVTLMSDVADEKQSGGEYFALIFGRKYGWVVNETAQGFFAVIFDGDKATARRVFNEVVEDPYE